MPVAGFDGKPLNLPNNSGIFLKLKKVGDVVKFRIANTPHYQTKHFIDDNHTVLCGRYNTEIKDAKCKYCDDYDKAVEAGDEEMQKQMRPVTTFYYPIVDMNDGKAKIFQFNAKSIHYTIIGYAKDVDVFACTWKVTRTEVKGSYYEVLRLDEKPLTKEQKEALEIAKKFNLESKESSSVTVKTDDEPSEDKPI
jgi:hypothetical protein